MANGLKVSLDNLIGTRDPAAVFADSAARTPLTDIFSKFNLSFEDAAAKFSELTSEGASNVTGALAEAVVAPIASAISYVVSFILIFIAAIVLLSILTHVLDLFAKLPVLKSANKLLGALAGLIYGIIIVWVLSIVLRFALPYLSAVNPALFPSTLFEDSFSLRLIYSLNAFKGVFLNNSFVSQFVK